MKMTLTLPPPLLMDMRWVYEHPKEAGEDEALKNARAMLKQSPKSFMEQLAALEKAWLANERAAREQLTAEANERARALPASSPSEDIPDAGTARLLEIAEQFLKAVV
jgi:hypothetical protein